MHALRVLLRWVWVLLPLAAAAQDPLHRRWTTADGLPSDRVYCALQDHEGYLWFATDMGVVRFNGRQFEAFGPEHGFSDPEVIDMALDGQGRIWFLMIDGQLAVRDGDRFLSPGELPDDGCSTCLANSLSLVEDAEGTLWQAGHLGEVRRLDLARGTLERLRISHGTVSLFRMRNGHIAGVDRRHFIRFNDTGHTRWERGDELIGTLARPPGNDPHALLLLTPAGISKWDGDTLLAVAPAAGWLRPEVHDRCFQDAEGTLWVRRRDHGIDRLHLRPDGPPELQHLFGDDQVHTVFTDRDGGHWYCTAAGVVHVLRGQRDARLVAAGTGERGEHPVALLPGGAGEVFCGSSTGRLHSYSNGTCRTLWPAPGEPTAGRIRTMDREGEAVWLATDETLARLHARSGAGYHAQAVVWVDTVQRRRPYSARSVHVTDDGRVLSGSIRLDVVREGAEGPERVALLPGEPGAVRVYAITSDAQGRVWHERNHELCLVSDGRATCRPLGAPEHIGRITDILPWRGDTLLVGTSAAGVLLVADGRVLHEHLPLEATGAERVVRLARGVEGVWVATGAGIRSLQVHGGRLHPGRAAVPGHDPRTMAVHDLLEHDGRLIAATSAGILDLPILAERREPHPPVAKLVAWTSPDRRYAGGDTLDLRTGRDPVRFQASALAFCSELPVEYGYALDGEGAMTTTAGEFELSALPEGLHTVRVAARYAGGAWSEPVRLSLRVSPPWYQRNAVLAGFWAGGVLLLAGLVLGLQQARHRRRLRALAAERALDAQRSRIAADLHDDLGADLSHLLLRTRQLAQQVPGGALQPLEQSLQQAIGRMDEVIWSVAPGRDTLQDVAEFVEKRMVERLEAAGLAVQVRLELPGDPVPIAAEHRRDLSLMLKEVVANIVKHAGAKQVRLEWRVEQGTSVVCVDDDGRGLPEQPAPGRHGLANLRKRAERWGGGVLVGPSPLGGTRVEVRTSLSPLVQTGEGKAPERSDHRTRP